MIKFVGCLLAILGVWWLLFGLMIWGVISLGMSALIFVLLQIRGDKKVDSPAQPIVHLSDLPASAFKAPNELAENKGFLLVMAAIVVLVVGFRYFF